MTSPIDIADIDISPLSLCAVSTPSPTSSFSDLSLGSGTLLDHVESRDRSDIVSLSSSTSSRGDDSHFFPSSCSPTESIPFPPTFDSTFDDSSSSIDSCTDPLCCPPPSPPRHSIKPLPPLKIPESSFHPLIIAGAGPHSLALAARLSEPRPAALYTDLEHARLSWLQREQGARTTPGKKGKKKAVKGHWSARKIIEPKQVTLAQGTAKDRGIKVLDSTSDQWMGRWKGFFEGLRIKTLRSPMLFHPAPADVDALVAYARRVGKEEDELEPIHGVVGKELSKHQKKKRVNGTIPINERDRQDYYRPSSRLFDSFISEDLISRYSLSGLVEHSTVLSISYEPIRVEGQEEPFQGFVVESRNPDGSISITASKAVVVAPGPSNRPNIPQVVKDALGPVPQSTTSTGCPWNPNEIRGENWCHSSAFSLPGFSPLSGPLGEKVRRGKHTTALVIGGGLTSVQIIDSLLAQGVAKVYLICRSHIKIKHFDFPLSWVSKYNNLEKASFWNSPTHQARLETIQSARDGGSVNPEFYKILNGHIKSGRVELRTLSSIVGAHYESLGTGAGGWTVQGETQPTPSRQNLGLVDPVSWELSSIDYLVSSTGSKIHLDSLDFMSGIRRHHPIDEVGGLPCLTGDLQWNEEVPLFVMGAYSMLELGPDALNLSGCRTGAERVAHRLGQLGIFKTVPRGNSRESRGDSLARDEGAGEGRKTWTRMEEKRHRSGGEGNFFRGLSVGVEA